MKLLLLTYFQFCFSWLSLSADMLLYYPLHFFWTYSIVLASSSLRQRIFFLSQATWNFCPRHRSGLSCLRWWGPRPISLFEESSIRLGSLFQFYNSHGSYCFPLVIFFVTFPIFSWTPFRGRGYTLRNAGGPSYPMDTHFYLFNQFLILQSLHGSFPLEWTTS